MNDFDRQVITLMRLVPPVLGPRGFRCETSGVFKKRRFLPLMRVIRARDTAYAGEVVPSKHYRRLTLRGEFEVWRTWRELLGRAVEAPSKDDTLTSLQQAKFAQGGQVPRINVVLPSPPSPPLPPLPRF